jgi:hypothetical protein
MGGVFRNFVKGTKSIGTWFGISKDRSGHGLHKLYGDAAGPDPIAQKQKNATNNLINATNALYASDRKRQRASALSTGAGPSGTATTTSAMAYGKPTLGS